MKIFFLSILIPYLQIGSDLDGLAGMRGFKTLPNITYSITLPVQVNEGILLRIFAGGSRGFTKRRMRGHSSNGRIKVSLRYGILGIEGGVSESFYTARDAITYWKKRSRVPFVGVFIEDVNNQIKINYKFREQITVNKVESAWLEYRYIMAKLSPVYFRLKLEAGFVWFNSNSNLERKWKRLMVPLLVIEIAIELNFGRNRWTQ